MSEYITTAIIKTLSYFQVFKYPLTKNEIWLYLSVECDKAFLESSLCKLVNAGSIFHHDNLYYLEDDPSVFQRRKDGNILAKQRLIKAKRIAKFLGNFPFVESVFISGSLSKNFTLPNGDLDFFIITAKDRLWIARSFMHIFKKLTFLFKAEHSFCMNYYLSVDTLEVHPKNLFTATELATLKPAFIQNGWDELYQSNASWVSVFLPNILEHIKTENHIDKKSLLSKLAEKTIDLLGGTLINTLCYKGTYQKWIYKWKRKGFNVEICEKSMAYHYNTPLNYPINFPDKIMNTYQKIVLTQEAKMPNKKVVGTPS